MLTVLTNFFYRKRARRVTGLVSARGVFRTLPNTNEGAFFAKIVNAPYLLTIFVKKLRHGCLTCLP